MIYTYSLIHLAFVALITLGWMLIDRKRDFKKYLYVTLIIGILGTVVFDFAGAIVFKFWYYRSENIIEYLFLSFCTYVVAAPVFIETQNFIMKKLNVFNLGLSFNTSRSWLQISFIFSLLNLSVVCLLELVDFIDRDVPFFAVAFVLFIILMDSFTFLQTGIKGPYTRFIEGQFLSPFSVIISGLICGLIWEILNQRFPLWVHLELPPDKILGIPAVVILFWGALNIGYWAGANILFHRLRNKNSA